MSHYKRYPAYKDSGVEWIGPVPEHWEIKRLEHVVSTHRENVAPDSLNPVNVLHFSIPAVQEIGGARVEAGSTIDSNKLIVRCPQVLISKLNPRKGTVIIADRDAELLTVASTEFVPLVPQHGRSVIPFIAALAVSEPLRQLLESRVESVTRSHQRVAPEDILKASVAIPPVDEQSAIAAALDRETARVDALIAKKIRFIVLLKEQRQALITHAVTKGLDPNVKMKDSGVEWIGEVPEHWSSIPIRRVARLESGHTPSRSAPDYWENCTIPWFTLADIWQVRREGLVVVNETSERISELGIANSSARKLPAGTVILSRTASVGFPAIMGCEMATSQDFAAWICSDRLYNRFLYLSLVAMREELGRLTMGSTHKTIYMPDIEQLRCPLPPVSEQQRIVEFVGRQTDRTNALAAKVERSITLLKERRFALITAAVTGKIDLARGDSA